jgi:hypothetical protein
MTATYHAVYGIIRRSRHQILGFATSDLAKHSGDVMKLSHAADLGNKRVASDTHIQDEGMEGNGSDCTDYSAFRAFTTPSITASVLVVSVAALGVALARGVDVEPVSRPEGTWRDSERGVRSPTNPDPSAVS